MLSLPGLYSPVCNLASGPEFIRTSIPGGHAGLNLMPGMSQSQRTGVANAKEPPSRAHCSVGIHEFSSA